MRRASVGSVRSSRQHTQSKLGPSNINRRLSYLPETVIGRRSSVKLVLVSGKSSRKLRHLLRDFLSQEETGSDTTDTDSDTDTASAPSSPAPVLVPTVLRPSKRLPRPASVSGHSSNELNDASPPLLTVPKRRALCDPLSVGVETPNPDRELIITTHLEDLIETTEPESPSEYYPERSVSPGSDTAGSYPGITDTQESSSQGTVTRRALSVFTAATSSGEPSGSHDASSSSDTSSRTFGPGSILPPPLASTSVPSNNSPTSQPAASSADNSLVSEASHQTSGSPVMYNVQAPTGRYSVSGWYVFVFHSH